MTIFPGTDDVLELLAGLAADDWTGLAAGCVDFWAAFWGARPAVVSVSLPANTLVLDRAIANANTSANSVNR